METKTALKAINERRAQECRCALKKTATQAVPGAGNPDADILFIGEAPGKDEDAQGEPFVGAAGKFLNEMLAAINLERSDVYVTNVVKYRPPNNRDPLPDEVRDCWPWLLEQINAIRPKLIVLLGRHALLRFFPGERISSIHGKLLKRKMKDIPVEYFFALYHPAAALYNGSMREVLMDDFKKLPKALKVIDVDRTKTKEVASRPPPSGRSPEQKNLF